MGSLNKALLIGRLGKEPEVRYTENNTAVATLNMATSDRYKDNNGDWQERTEWHRVVCWGRLAEIAQQFLKKGSQVYIEGSIHTRQWQDKDGQTRYTTEIKAAALQMLDAKSSSDSDSSANRENSAMNTKNPARQNQEIPQSNEFSNYEDDELPF